MKSEVKSILLSAEARMRRRFHIEEAVRIKHARVKKRNHPKRHGENRERAQLAQKKAREQKHKKILAKNARQKYINAVKAYWLGESDKHP